MLSTFQNQVISTAAGNSGGANSRGQGTGEANEI
jgi:hypothetical protein